MDTGESGAISRILSSSRINGPTPGSDRQYGQKQKQFKRNSQAGDLPAEEETVDVVDLSEEYTPHTVAAIPVSRPAAVGSVAKAVTNIRKTELSHIDIEV